MVKLVAGVVLHIAAVLLFLYACGVIVDWLGSMLWWPVAGLAIGLILFFLAPLLGVLAIIFLAVQGWPTFWTTVLAIWGAAHLVGFLAVLGEDARDRWFRPRSFPGSDPDTLPGPTVAGPSSAAALISQKARYPPSPRKRAFW